MRLPADLKEMQVDNCGRRYRIRQVPVGALTVNADVKGGERLLMLNNKPEG